MSKKIAPMIQGWLNDCDAHGLNWHKPMKAEIRALVACALALRGLSRPPAPCPPICREWDVAFRALARLDRLSSGTGKRKEGSRG